jgi:hypothetical protein
MYENNSIYNSLKKIKYLGVNLTKDMKDLYTRRTTNLWIKRLGKTMQGGEISHAHRLIESA